MYETPNDELVPGPLKSMSSPVAIVISAKTAHAAAGIQCEYFSFISHSPWEKFSCRTGMLPNGTSTCHRVAKWVPPPALAALNTGNCPLSTQRGQELFENRSREVRLTSRISETVGLMLCRIGANQQWVV